MHRHALATLALCTVLLLVGCRSVEVVPPVPPGDPISIRSPMVVVVSNQSFDDPDVGLTISLDGRTLVEESFAVEDQHTQTAFGVDPEPGRHTVAVTSDTGATATQSVELPDGQRRWVYVDYWYVDPSRPRGTLAEGEEPGPAIHLRVSAELIPMAMVVSRPSGA